MDTMEYIRDIVYAVLAFLMFYKGVYTVLGVFTKPKVFADAPMTKKYGVVIAARNEEKVIGHLVDSLMAQTYPTENYRIFVVADNCTDGTARVAREHGATVYERSCPEKARKGWALEFLFECIERDFGIKSFDGYLFFDADNVVSADYLEQMNKAFATDCDAVIGYRNTKNFDRNWISAHYAIHFMRSTMTFHRPRSRLGLSTHIAGTGYLLSSELLKDGWHYSCLTEDTQATMDFSVQGKRIEYCEAAEFYDEQPYQLKVMARQRIRWAKGRLACFFAYGHRLLVGIFKRFGKDKGDKESIKQATEALEGTVNNAKSSPLPEILMTVGTAVTDFFGKLIRPVSKNVSCYDMFFYLFPNSLFYKLVNIAYYVAGFIVCMHLGEAFAEGAAEWVIAGLGLLFGSAFTYIGNMLFGLIVVLREWRHVHCSKKKLACFLLTWPIHDMMYAYLCIASLFMHVKWKPIKHDEAISLDDIEGKKRA